MDRRSSTLLLVHVVWSTERRARTLPIELDPWLGAAVRARARGQSVDALAVGASDDHVHALLRLLPTTPLSTVMQWIKGGIAYTWNRIPGRERLVWQEGYWAESFGPASLPGLTRYLARQRVHHRRDRRPEPWELNPRKIGVPTTDDSYRP